MATRNYNNVALPIPLTVGVNNVATTLTVGTTTGYPTAPFLIALERGTPNEEVVLCTASAATTFTVQRGFDNTTGKAHNVGAIVEHTAAAIDYNEANAHHNNTALDEHSQYMRTDGVRHDLTARHTFGTSLPTPSDPTASAPGNAAAPGSAAGPARADHVHGRESYATIRDSVFPPGMLAPYVGAAAPAGWLLCTGGFVSQVTYAALFAVAGHAYNGGVDPGNGTFKLPDLRQRVPLGKADTGVGSTLGGTGGSKDAIVVSHSHTVNSHSHGGGTGGVGDHAHGMSHGHGIDGVGDHRHMDDLGYNYAFRHSVDNDWFVNSSAANRSVGTTFTIHNATGGHNHTLYNFNGNTGNGGSHSHSVGAESPGTDAQGSSGADANMQPFQAFNYIVKI